MHRPDRRGFMKVVAAAGTTASLAHSKVAQGQADANSRIRIGLIGLGGRMAEHVACLAALEHLDNIEIAAICDCDQEKIDSATTRYPQLAGKNLAIYTDVRKLLDDKSIDAVSIATQDHWHALQTIWACQAGKDVYLEKPGTHNLYEGRQMVAAARKYKRIVQHGTQCRSNAEIREGIERLKDGVIGEVYLARAIDYKPRGSLGNDKPAPAPKGLDWDKWVGPAPLVPYSEFRHRRWYWIKEFASGIMANQGIHNLDIARWGLGFDKPPSKIQSMGGRFVHEDDSTMPNYQNFSCQYDDGRIIEFEARGWLTNDEAGMRDKYHFVVPGQAVGTVFLGSKGYMVIPNYNSYYTYLGKDLEPGPSRAGIDYSAHLPRWSTESIPHFKNWLAAIRSRTPDSLNAEIEEGRRSMVLPLLGNVAYWTGRTLNFDGNSETCVDDNEANDLLTAHYRAPYEVPKDI